MIYFVNTTCHWVDCCLACFIASVRPFLLINFDYWLLCFSNQDIRLTVCMTGQQGMLTAIRQLNPPLVNVRNINWHNPGVISVVWSWLDRKLEEIWKTRYQPVVSLAILTSKLDAVSHFSHFIDKITGRAKRTEGTAVVLTLSEKKRR